MPRLVATDLDGTLLRSDGTVAPRTSAAIRDVQDAGIEVVLVTGRPPRYVRAVAEQAGVRGPVVCANGALVYDPVTETVLRTSPLTTAVARRVLSEVADVVDGCAVAVETAEGLACDESYAALARWPVPEGSVRSTRDELWSRPPVKVLVRAPHLDFEELVRQVRAVVGHHGFVTHSMPGLVEVSAAGITKQTELALVCDAKGIDAEHVVAFGDMPNDIPMLAWAGHAVAVGNAHPDVLAAVDEVTATNDDDGVAQVLERLLTSSRAGRP